MSLKQGLMFNQPITKKYGQDNRVSASKKTQFARQMFACLQTTVQKCAAQKMTKTTLTFMQSSKFN